MGSGMRLPFIRPYNSCGFVLTRLAVQVDKREDPYAPQQQGGCCSIM